MEKPEKSLTTEKQSLIYAFLLLVGEEKILCFNLLVDQATDNVAINVE